jgi:cyclophilin family peptidyl-prolyl cis-trans isomerase
VACAVIASAFSSPLLAANTIVHMEIAYGTNQGAIDIELYDDQAPITVANFLRYAGRGDYTTNGFIHRSVPGFILQGGGYIYGEAPPPVGLFVIRIPVLDPPIQNEFSASRSNIRGTIAMAKLAGQPNSATSEWFFNLADNSANLDYQNGGFTVFGRVLDNGMDVVDAIANLPIWNLTSVNGALGSLPLDNFDPTVGLQPGNFVRVTRIPNVASAITNLGPLEIFTADADMVFDYVRTVDTPTAVSRLAAFTSPPNQSFYFNNGMFTLSMTGVMGPTGRIVTMYDGASVRPTHYYAYGPTPDNPAPHWYNFAFDGETGAEIGADRITLHFVDGMRGDDDLDPNNGSITHTGAQAVVTTTASTQSTQAGGGCSIVTTPSQTSRGGDWIVVSLFLAFVALVRKRARNGRIQRTLR